MSYLLTEKLSSALVVWMILKRVTRPFKDWEAAKLGLISPVDGKKLRKPRTARERESFDPLDRFCWSLKRITNRFHGDNRFAHLLSMAYLMRENYVPTFKANLERYKPELEELTLIEEQKIHKFICAMESSNVLFESQLDLETNAIKIKDTVNVNWMMLTPTLVEDMDCGSTSLGDVSQFTPSLNINMDKVQRRRKLRRKKNVRREL